MQGHLNEIDIRSILQLIELGQRTGELFVETYVSASPFGGLPSDRARPPSEHSWFVFFVNGHIAYATSGDGNLLRLRDYLRRYKVDAALDSVSMSAIASINAPEYGYLWSLLENHLLTPSQGRSIIRSMVHETLFDLLSLHHGSFIFEISPPLTPQLTTLEIAPIVTDIIKQVQAWKQLHPHIQSPDQCPAIADPEQLREALPITTFKTVERWIDGKTSIRQMARYLNRDILTVARAVYPYIQQGLVQLVYPTVAAPSYASRGLSTWPEARPPRIVCIDDGTTIRKAVEYILHRHGYEATAIGNPLKALSLVFHLKPDLILCDIAMPELDGYEICAMLRSSTAFRQTPIIMLTGKDGFIDRVKARIVGATDYLTKPFGESELLMLVEKYVGVGNPELPKPDVLLAEALGDEVKLNIHDQADSVSS